MPFSCTKLLCLLTSLVAALLFSTYHFYQDLETIQKCTIPHIRKFSSCTYLSNGLERLLDSSCFINTFNTPNSLRNKARVSMLWATRSLTATWYIYCRPWFSYHLCRCNTNDLRGFLPSLQHRQGERALWSDFQLISTMLNILHGVILISQQRNLDPSPSLSNTAKFNLFLLIHLYVFPQSFYKWNILLVWKRLHHVNPTLNFYLPLCKPLCKSYLRMDTSLL